MSWRRKALLAALLGVIALFSVLLWVYGGGELESRGVPVSVNRPAAAKASHPEPPVGTGETILFGDLHVHTTFSADAFLRSLPISGGEGVHPPADACDYARFCSRLDFFALTDHAEGLTPHHWRETREAVRECNAVGGMGSSPELVAFTGFEWTQVGDRPETHYGHKNVIFKDTADDALPARPIAAPGLGSALRVPPSELLWIAEIPWREYDRRQRYLNFGRYLRINAMLDKCPAGVPSPELPADCKESAATPAELYRKLGEWGHEALVIPHGTTWGFYTPPGSRWDKQLTPAQRDARYVGLIEVFSGHGNSEEWRKFLDVKQEEDGAQCPPPQGEGEARYEPCCWRAGEIVRGRCGDIPAEVCEARVEKARADYLRAGVGGHLTLAGTPPEAWGDCGQCRDCFNPSFAYRPGGSAQYIVAKGDFSDADRPAHATLGFIASSDNHSARPGTGYKEHARRRLADSSGPQSEDWRRRFFGPRPVLPESKSYTREELGALIPFQVVHIERQGSFFMTGGLVAVHARGRDRGSIWRSLRRRQVYGTSGERILLWFDHVGAEGQRTPMGAELATMDRPRFRVRALGAFEQEPGCPPWVTQALGAERVERLCAGECYRPSDRRRRITRIEVVRIRRQSNPDEGMDILIDDPWETLPCAPEVSTTRGCEVSFEDSDYTLLGRDTLYYVRAIQEPTPAVNADPLRCEYDSSGVCTKATLCYGDDRTPADDDCLSPNEERAWSSPIYLRWARR